MKRLLMPVIVACVGLVATSTTAFADQTFHSVRLSLVSVGGSPLRNGDVVDIHDNGPVNYAIEEYHLAGATANTTYDVEYLVTGAPFGTAVCGSGAFPFPNGATVKTDLNGNGNSQLKIPPSFVTGLGLHNTTLGLIWVLLDSGSPAYQTSCISVGLD
ncbi:MAG: hypothetical protein E6I11_14280 [Chloroflexi bacterium]|nr:MAG: hypothetical protein E6I17_05290 [Chloroflexota bacterium]TMF82371.1 MAG: hypothetical protein E6I11_14280 [Chloroflexota bacterium]TMG12536.1 MAG: hypothetical protein E6I00_06200 [Chloroflexota bacterium]